MQALGELEKDVGKALPYTAPLPLLPYKYAHKLPAALGQLDHMGALTALHGVYETSVRMPLSEAAMASGLHPAMTLLLLPLLLKPAVAAASSPTLGPLALPHACAPEPPAWCPLRDLCGARMLVRCAEAAPEEALLPMALGVPAVLALLRDERRAALAKAAAAATEVLDEGEDYAASSAPKRAKKAEKGVRL